ncbi:MAG: LysR substrate-binding domain-containing protein [Panacagrimonas sp.]
MDDPIHMVTFARVVEANSFAAAAKRLGVSMSVASKHVAKLEKSLGARLLNRSTRKLSLTEAGQAFYTHCARLIEELEASDQAIAETQAEVRGQLRVSAPPSMVALHIAPALAEFRRRYPLLELEFDLSNRVIDFAEEGYDMALRVSRQPAPELMSRTLAPLNIVMVAAPAYVGVHGAPQHPADLAQHECLLFSLDADPTQWILINASGQSVPVQVRGAFRSNVMEPLHKMALHGLGIAQLPTYMVGQDVERGSLLHLLPEWSGYAGAQIHAVWPPHRRDSRKVRLFVEFLAEHFGDEPYWERALKQAAQR